MFPKWKPPPVPEIAIDKHRQLSSTKNDIRPAGKFFRVFSKIYLASAQFCENDFFRAGVLSLYSCHHATASLFGNDVPPMRAGYTAVSRSPCSMPCLAACASFYRSSSHFPICMNSSMIEISRLVILPDITIRPVEELLVAVELIAE